MFQRRFAVGVSFLAFSLILFFFVAARLLSTCAAFLIY